MAFRIEPGVRNTHRGAAAALFWAAFEGKLGAVMRPERKAIAFLTRVMDGDHAISALDEAGALLGVAGFKTADGAFIGGGLGDMTAIYGPLGGLWRGVLLDILERERDERHLLMDGIFVAPEARGRGVGGALLDAVAKEAARRGLSGVRLDVIDTNPRARALYERKGFVATSVADLGPLRHLFGFRRATTMIRPMDRPSPA
ncbi:MAG: GNAT family N-acetyltransferase [Pseudomonadota bacterium]